VSTWTARSSVNNNNWSAIEWAPELGLFACVSFSGNNSGVITSPDGINWTTQTTPTGQYRGICWSPQLGLFAAVSIAGTAATAIMTSPDGISWTPKSAPNTNTYFDVTWSPQLGLFAAVASGGVSADRVITSTNGDTWTPRAAPRNCNGIVWAPELTLFVAVGGGSNAMTSTDGIIWNTLSIATADWTSVAWSPELGLFVAVAQSGASRAATSPDGFNWTLRSISALNWIDVCWAPELGLFAAVTYNIGTTPKVSTSPDGINWTLRTTPYESYLGICWSPELGIFAAANFSNVSSNRIMTSSLAGRPPTSYNVFDSSFNSIDQNGNWTFSNTNFLNLPTYTGATDGVNGNPNPLPGNNQFITKKYADNMYGGTGTAANLLNSNNTWSGINTFQNNTYLATTTNTSVGIGKTGPSATLDVSGNALISGTLGVNGTITGPTGSFTFLSASSGITGPTGSFTFISSTSGITGPTGSFTNLTSSNNTFLATTTNTSVGIGKTNASATASLDVSGNALISGTLDISNNTSSSFTIRNTNATNPGVIRFTSDTSGNFFQSGTTSGVTTSSREIKLGPWLSNNWSMLLDVPNNRLGVGLNITPTETLHVDGTALITGLCTFQTVPICTTSATTTNQLANFNNFAETSFTPVLAGTGGSAATYSSRGGRFTRINNVCFFQAFITLSAVNITGSLNVSLPVATGSIGASFSIGSINGLNGSNYNSFFLESTSTASSIANIKCRTALGDVNVSNLTAGQITASFSIRYGGSYIV
jgi:hypothetical protein